MPHVVFVAPHFLENTNRYVAAFAALDDVTLSVVSEDPEEAIPAPLRQRVSGHYRVRQSLDGGELTTAVRAIGRGVGGVDRLTGALEQLQVPMAEARDALGIEGLGVEVAKAFRDKDRMKSSCAPTACPWPTAPSSGRPGSSPTSSATKACP